MRILQSADLSQLKALLSRGEFFWLDLHNPWLVNHIGSGWTFWGLGIGGLFVAVVTIVLWLIRSGLYDGPRSRTSHRFVSHRRRRDPTPRPPASRLGRT